MKTIPQPPKLQRRHQITTLALNIGLVAGLSALPLHAEDDDNSPAGSNSWNRQQSQSDQQTSRNQQQNRGDLQSGRNQQDRSDLQTGRNQQYDLGDQQTGRNQQDRSDSNQQAQRDQDDSMQSVSFDGKVDSAKKVVLINGKGESSEQTFVRISLNDGDTRDVSIGSRLILSDLDLEKGDEISITGQNARIDNRNVLVASRIEVDDKLFLVRKHNRPDTDAQASTTGTRNFSVDGDSTRVRRDNSVRDQSTRGDRNEPRESSRRDSRSEPLAPSAATD